MLVFSFGAYIKTPWSPPPQQKESKRDTASLGCLLPWFTGFTALDWKSWHVPGVERRENHGTCGESSWRSALLPDTHSRGVLQDETLTGELLWWPGRKNVILWRRVITWTLGWSLWAMHVCERFPGLSSSQVQGERTNRGELVAIRSCTCTGAAWEGINTQAAPEKKARTGQQLKKCMFFFILYTLPTCWPVAGFHRPGDQFAILCFKGLLRPSYRLKPHLHQKGFTGTGIYYTGKALLSRIPLKQHNQSSPGLLTPPHHAPWEPTCYFPARLHTGFCWRRPSLLLLAPIKLPWLQPGDKPAWSLIPSFKIMTTLCRWSGQSWEQQWFTIISWKTVSQRHLTC